MDYTYKAFVTRVYDGDTITVDIDLGFGIKMHGQKLRLLGINTPEVRGSERSQGIVSRDFLSDLIYNKIVVIKTEKDKTGKYGRYLATVFLDGENINEKLVQEGFAQYKSY